MSGSADWSKFKTRKRPAVDPRKVEPVRILTAQDKAALIANRPDLHAARKVQFLPTH